jgi:archaellum component FlaC
LKKAIKLRIESVNKHIIPHNSKNQRVLALVKRQVETANKQIRHMSIEIAMLSKKLK